jgi:dipeptidyl aminopeptidase/acylaminoacyl peptidase
MFPTALHLARRGISCLAVDNPGQGAALRDKGLVARHDSEIAAGAAFDFLAKRADVDRARIGIMAASMGGYYAPRAVAFDKRFKACVSWAAIYDYHAIWARRIARLSGELAVDTKVALGTTGSHLLHIMGVRDFAEALKKLEPFNLRGIAEKISCDILVVHGADDRQTPIEDAMKLFEAIGSPRKELKVYRREDGGSAHVQIDRSEPANSLIADWFVDHL